MSTSSSAKDFFQKLNAKKLAGPMMITGMVKQMEGKNENFLFSFSNNCNSWIEIPMNLVEKIEYLTSVACKDHEHPFVRIMFREASGKNAEASLYLNLLQSQLKLNIALCQPDPGIYPNTLRTTGPNQPVKHQRGECVTVLVPICWTETTGGDPDEINGGYKNVTTVTKCIHIPRTTCW